MRRVLDPPVEVLVSLTTPFCKRVELEGDAEVATIGRWMVVRRFEQDEYGDPFVVDMRAFVFDDELEAATKLEQFLATERAAP